LTCDPTTESTEFVSTKLRRLRNCAKVERMTESLLYAMLAADDEFKGEVDLQPQHPESTFSDSTCNEIAHG
jgi:hypothetical protein